MANLDFKDASLKMEEPPFAVSDITANAIFTPNLIRIESLKGCSWEGTISVAGQIEPAAEPQRHSYSLTLYGKNAEINDNMLGILPAALKSFASKLQPRGKVNFAVDLKKAPQDNHAGYQVIVECLRNSVGSPPATEPQKQAPAGPEWSFYPLKDITGSLTITNDSLRLAEITATAADNNGQTTPGATTLTIDGEIAITDDAFAGGQFAVHANDVLFDRRLHLTLPKDLQMLCLKLSPEGRFDFDFESITIRNAAKGKRYVDLAGDVRLKDCSFDIGGGISDLNAQLEIKKGVYETDSHFRADQVSITAKRLKTKSVSLTKLKADFYYDQNRESWLTENLISDCYQGRLTGKLEFKQPSDTASEYLLQTGFDNIDLRQFLADAKGKATSGNNHTTGKMSGSLSVIHRNGKIAGHNYQRLGRCRLQITDMKVGKASLLARLLSVLKLTEPKDSAFDRMLVDSYIKGDRVYLEHLDLVGDAITFSGSGWLDWQNQNINIILFARGSRLAAAKLSILESLPDAIGPAVVRMDVTGNLYDAQVTVTTLPIIKGTLELFGTK
jgi:autotransporter translocation and assembly factor TamB